MSTQAKAQGLLAIYNALQGTGAPDSALLDEALQVAAQIEDAGPRAEALRDIAATRAQAGHSQEAMLVFAQAQEMAVQIEDAGQRAEALRAIAAALARARRFAEALNTLDIAGLSMAAYIAAQADWTISLNQVDASLGVHALQDAMRIMGWVNPGWQRIDTLLSQNRRGEDGRAG